MRKVNRHIVRWVMLLFLCCGAASANSQSFEVQQLILDIQKLTELKSILQDLKAGYQVLDKGYSTIRDISKGSFDLHKAFLDGLLAVSPAVKNYARVAAIIQVQLSILSKYKTAWGKFRQDPHFRPDELVLMGTVYANLIDETGKELDDLTTILTDGQIRASDAERLNQIDAIYATMSQQERYLDGFDQSNALLSMQRASDQNDLDTLKKLYGITGQ